ncbi:DUF6398 domain-containing protein [Desulfoplanes sp.]
MTSKGKQKQRKALERRLRKKANAIPALDGLGEYFQEFLLRSVYIYSLRHGQKSIPEVTARIKTLVNEKKLDKLALLLGVDKMPLEKGQILAYRAMATKDTAQAKQLVLKAMEQDPSNIDARMWQARHDFETSKFDPAQIQARMQAIVDLGTQMHGPEIENLAGRVHEIPIARPYLRALNSLFTTLIDCEKFQDALPVGQKLLSLCSPDKFDIGDRVETLEAHVGGFAPGKGEQDDLIDREEQIAPAERDERGQWVDDAATAGAPELSPERVEIFRELSELLEGFCYSRTDAPFTPLALEAANRLCRDASCPVHRGKRESWASGIVHGLAQVNSMLGSGGGGLIQPVDIHTHFKVSSSTTSKKSAQIKKILDMQPDNPDWLIGA